MRADIIELNLNVLIERKIIEGKKIMDRISVLNYQLQNYKNMFNNYKIEVIEGMIKDIKKYDMEDNLDWSGTLEEIEEVKKHIK